MKNSIFLKSTIILLIGGIITKLLGMIIKILMSRLLGTEGIGLYMLITPTFMLLITISQLGFPMALSKFVAEDTKNNKNLVFSLIPVSIIINIFIIFLLLLCSRFISINLLKDQRLYYPILFIGLVIPFTTISSILRSYFFGKQKMMPHVISNIIEDIIRLVLLAIGIPIFIKYGLEKAISFIIISNIISELASILILFLFLPKSFKITKKDLKPNKQYIKDSLYLGIPNTLGKLIGTIGYFLEPIILTFSLLLNGYTNKYIIYEYGIISGYVMPLLLLPSFFSLAISQALLPTVSKNSINKNYKYIRKKIRQAVILGFLIGLVFTCIIYIYPEFFLKTLYNTKEGIPYLRILAPICLFQYIQAPLAFTLDGLGKSKITMISTLLGTITRCIILLIGPFLKLGIYSLIISIGLNILVVTLYQIKEVTKIINNKI